MARRRKPPRDPKTGRFVSYKNPRRRRRRHRRKRY